jgi:hypothetical protein
MKTLKSIFLLFAFVFVTSSCDDKETLVDQVMDGTTYGGGVLRTIKINNLDMDNDNFATTKFSVTVEVQDIQNGQLMDKVKVYAKFLDKNGNGNSKPETLFKTLTKNDFLFGQTGQRELPYLLIDAPLSQLKTLFNLTDAQVKTCDQFEFRLELVQTDGKVFSVSNSSPTLFGGYFSSPFKYTSNVKGGVYPDNLAGTHTFVTTGMYIPGSASCGGTATGSVTWTSAGAEGLYSTSDLSFGLFQSSCWSDGPATSATARVKWFCKDVTSTGGDQYGSTWAYTVKSCVGNKLTITFKSSYGTGEGGTTVITRQGGANWPLIMQQ